MNCCNKDCNQGRNCPDRNKMKITRAHIMGWIALAIAGAALVAEFSGQPEPAAAEVKSVPAKPLFVIAAGNLWLGTKLYFGQHDRIYRGQIVEFIDTPQGEAAVLMKDGKTEVLLRKDIAIRDFWVQAD